MKYYLLQMIEDNLDGDIFINGVFVSSYLRKCVQNLLLGKGKIAAIKLLMSGSGLGLYDSKCTVENPKIFQQQ